MDGFTPVDDRATEAAARRRIERWNGIAEQYDAFRPSAPDVLPSLLAQLAGTPMPAHVVDIGAGTGLSTLVWAGHAQLVTGIEPNADMRRQAEARLAAIPDEQRNSVRFIAASAEHTGLPDAYADIVTASQAFHWMEPVATLAEVARILRPGGVFAAYDYDWPPTITPETDMLFHDFMSRVLKHAEALGISAEPPGWKKSGHLERMRESGHFRLTKEIVLHSVGTGDADRFIGLTLSNVTTHLLAHYDLAPDELGIAAFEREARRAFADANASGIEPSWYVSYHMRIGVK
jgi:ubiquinone/menaquinone biosynthesis C-methylase UbiE